MKSHTRTLTMHVPRRMGFVNITPQVAAEVAASGIDEGLCLVNAMHITASVFINDDEQGLRGGGRCDRRQAALRPVGADLLR